MHQTSKNIKNIKENIGFQFKSLKRQHKSFKKMHQTSKNIENIKEHIGFQFKSLKIQHESIKKVFRVLQTLLFAETVS